MNMENFRNITEKGAMETKLNITSQFTVNPYTTERIILHCFASPFIIILGIVGNILTTAVLYQLKEKSTASLYLFSLAISDTLTLLLIFIYTVSVWAKLFFPSHVSPWFLNSQSFVTLSHSPERISKLILVAIVIERVTAVYFPFKVRIIFTRFRAKIAIAIFYIVSLGCTLPTSIDVFIFDVKNRIDTEADPDAQFDPLAFLKFSLNTSLGKVIIIAFSRIVFDTLPILIVAGCNCAIIIGLKQKNDIVNYATHSSRKEKERKLTRLLLMVSFCFLLLCGPFDCYILFVITGTITLSDSVLLMNEIFKTISLLNSAVNFIIYAFMNKRYRQKYAEIFLCCECCSGNDIEGEVKLSDIKETTTNSEPQLSTISKEIKYTECE